MRTLDERSAAECEAVIEGLRRTRLLLHDRPCGRGAAATARLHAVARRRWLDVGGDGTVAAAMLRTSRGLSCDVFNFPVVGPVIATRARRGRLRSRLGFIAGDWLHEPLPDGYDVLSFIRVLQAWPMDVTHRLLGNARAALRAGGRLVVCEEGRTDERNAAALVDLGFRDVRVMRVGIEIVTALA